MQLITEYVKFETTVRNIEEFRKFAGLGDLFVDNDECVFTAAEVNSIKEPVYIGPAFIEAGRDAQTPDWPLKKLPTGARVILVQE